MVGFASLLLVRFLGFGSSTYAPGAKSESESTSKGVYEYIEMLLIDSKVVNKQWTYPTEQV